MATSARERLTRVALGLVLLAGVVAVTFGAGYRASDALLDGASAYVQKDHTVVRVNAESRDSDAAAARELAKGTERLEVVQIAPGVVYVVNNATGTVWRLPTDTLKPTVAAGGDRTAVDNPPRVVAGGKRAYLFDQKHGTLTLLEDPDGHGRRDIALPKPPAEVVVDRSGMAWALSRQVGELYGVADGSVVARHHVAGAWEPALLTLVGDRPVVYRPERGVATMFDRGGQVRAVEVPKEATWNGVQVGAPGTDSKALLITSQKSGELIKVDFADGHTRRTRLARPGDNNQFGSSVEAHGRVYVPDYVKRRVIVVELDSLRQVSSMRVPGTKFWDINERDGRVWVNDPYAKDMLSFDKDGRPVTIDKTQGYAGESGESRTPKVQRTESRPSSPSSPSPTPPGCRTSSARPSPRPIGRSRRRT